MNIYINGRFLTQFITGVQRYACEIVKALDKLIETEQNIKKNKYTIICPKNTTYLLELKNIKLKKVGYLKGHIWEQIELPLYTRDGYLINLCNVAPLIKTNQIVTIHDVAVYACPQGFSKLFQWWYKIIFLTLGKTLKHIITVSEFSKQELIKYCKISDDKIHVIHLGIEHISNLTPDGKVLQKYHLQDKKYIFAVSSLNHNKNFKMVIEAAKINPQNLYVIAGGTNPKVFSKNQLELPENVKYIGYITDEELVDLYRHAGCFIYPSLYEGFGLPPLEAMAWGCPVVVSRRASLPEICGNAAIYCDPNNKEDIAEKIRKLLMNNVLRNRLIKNGHKRISAFQWNKTVSRLIDSISINYTFK